MDIVTDYRILENADHDELAKEVRDLIREGWRPQGGVACVSIWKEQGIWYQAMVRVE